MEPILFIVGLIIFLVVLLFSAILHEVAHGVVADRLGDPTARLMGRLTLNPRPHIDLFMSILLPLVLAILHLPVFAAAKPVPVDPFNLKDGKKDLALVSLAGPLTNILLAVVAAVLLHIFNLRPAPTSAPLGSFAGSVPILTYLIDTFLNTVVITNLYLAIFNLLPIPPLDGSKVFALLLPDRQAASYLSLGTVGILLLFMLLSFPIGGFYLPSFINQLFQLALRLLGL